MTEHLSPEEKRALEAAEQLVQARDYVAAETVLASLPPVTSVVESRAICLSRTGRWRDIQRLLLPLRAELPAHTLLLLAEAILRSRHSFGDRSSAEDVAFAFERLISVATAPGMDGDAGEAVMLLAMHAAATPTALLGQLTEIIRENARRTPEAVELSHALDTLAGMGDRLPYLERAKVLRTLFDAGARSACVHWRIGMLFHWAGDHQAALQWIDAAITSAAGGTSDPAVLTVAKAELLVLNNQPHEALALLEELLDNEAEPFHAPAHLAALRAAAATSDPEGLGRRAKALAAHLAADPYRALFRFSDPFDVLELNGPAWVVPQRWYTQSDPRPIANQLAAVPDPEASAWMRFLVVSMRDNSREPGDESDDVPSAWISYLAGAAEATGHHPVLVGHEAFLRMRAPRPNWRALGVNWMAASLDVRQAGASSLWYLPSRLSDEPEHMSRFAEGVAKTLRVLAPAPDAYDIIVEEAEFAASLISHKLHRSLLAVMKPITENDQRAGPWFYLGYALHSLDKHAEALRAYAISLKNEPAHFSAIFNSLLICSNEKNQPLLDELAARVTTHAGAFSAEEREKLESALVAAQKRCNPPEAVLKAAVAAYPPLTTRFPSPADLSLRQAVALLALLVLDPARGAGGILMPFDRFQIPFGPQNLRQELFRLMERGLITPDSQTPVSAVVDKGDGRFDWYFGKVYWRLSPIATRLADALIGTGLRRPWPSSWAAELPALAHALAKSEIRAYIEHLALERSWAPPDNEERLEAFLAESLQDLSVAQAYYVAYLSAQSASDWLMKYGRSRAEPANVLLKRGLDRIERIRRGEWEPKSYRRISELPRSACHIALWREMLGKGDAGFDTPFNAIDWPQPDMAAQGTLSANDEA